MQLKLQKIQPIFTNQNTIYTTYVNILCRRRVTIGKVNTLDIRDAIGFFSEPVSKCGAGPVGAPVWSAI